MSPSRHRAAAPALRVRVMRLAVPAALATVATGLVVVVGLTTATGKSTTFDVPTASAPMKISASQLSDRTRSVSRAAPRVELEPQPVAKKFATADLNIWTGATDKSKNIGTVDSGTKVSVTGQVVHGWAEVLLKGKVRYVNADYLTDEKPDGIAATSGISLAPCPDGSGTESGLTPAAVRLFRAVCAAFPALSSYGGWDAHGEHSSGRAIDFMVPNAALGRAVADWIRAHAAELDIYDVLWSQHIWTPERGGEGWRSMPDRGSATANHYDHVHASVY
jgi:hypothetical protein